MERFLKEIDCLRIKPGRTLSGGIKGNYKGTGLGESLDFHGHRSYMRGDDTRKINWKAYLKNSSLYIREFTEERQLSVNIILDSSMSMNYGSPSKFEVARMLASGIAYLALKQMDEMSFYTFGEELNCLQYRARGMQYFYGLMETLKNTGCEGKTDFNELKGVKTSGNSINFFISDFFTTDMGKVLDYLAGRGGETVLIHLLSDMEINPGLNGELKLVDMETGQIRRIHCTEKMNRTYMEKLNNHMDKLKQDSIKRGMKYVFASCDSLPSQILFSALGGC